jgi:hypothetical protein
MPRFRDQLKKLNIALDTNYIAIFACRTSKRWPKDIAQKTGVKDINIASLASGFVQGTGPVSLALLPGVNIHSPFENSHEESLRLRNDEREQGTSGVLNKRLQEKIDKSRSDEGSESATSDLILVCFPHVLRLRPHAD